MNTTEDIIRYINMSTSLSEKDRIIIMLLSQIRDALEIIVENALVSEEADAVELNTDDEIGN